MKQWKTISKTVLTVVGLLLAPSALVWSVIYQANFLAKEALNGETTLILIFVLLSLMASCIGTIGVIYVLCGKRLMRLRKLSTKLGWIWLGLLLIGGTATIVLTPLLIKLIIVTGSFALIGSTLAYQITAMYTNNKYA